MKTPVLLTILTLAINSCAPASNTKGAASGNDTAEKGSVSLPGNKSVDADYQNRLLATKKFYPFDHWREHYQHGLMQYTNENCNKVRTIFDELIDALIVLGPHGGELQKKQLFQKAILKINQLNNTIGDLIETGEREELCELTNQITIACGLNPKQYGDGEGLASEWREW